MEDLQRDFLSGVGLQVDDEARQQLSSSAKWTKFIAIVMFIACGLILLVGLIGGTALSATLNRLGSSYVRLGNFAGPVLIAFVIIVVAVMAVIYYFLFNFSQKVSQALIADNTAELNSGLKSLKTFFIITTVIALLSVVLDLYNLIKTS